MPRQMTDLDPGVLAALTDHHTRKATRGMNGRQKQRYQQEQRQIKKTYRLDRELVDTVEAIAAYYGTTATGVLSWLLVEGLMAITQSEADPVLESSDSPRWSCTVKLETADIETICHAARDRYE